MKDRRYANRGQTLEEIIRYTNDRYRMDGLATVCKIPTEFIPIRDASGRVVSCKVKTRSTVDFIGRVGTMPLAAEAKETRSDSIRFDEVQDHQASFLTAYEGHGEAVSIVVVSFSLNGFYVVPWPFWKAARDAWKEAQRFGKKKAEKHTITFDGETWTTPGKASVREEELLPDWRVELGGRYGFDYLHRYIERGTIAKKGS